MHIIGQRGDWNERLEAGLSSWDHDKDILDNVMRMFGECLTILLGIHCRHRHFNLKVSKCNPPQYQKKLH